MTIDAYGSNRAFNFSSAFNRIFIRFHHCSKQARHLMILKGAQMPTREIRIPNNRDIYYN